MTAQGNLGCWTNRECEWNRGLFRTLICSSSNHCFNEQFGGSNSSREIVFSTLGADRGGSFPYLVEAVTRSGAVVGVEISPGMARSAKHRVESNGWTNVDVITSDAKKVELQGTFDAWLMLGAPDVYASGGALTNLSPYLKSNARVVAFGAKLSHHRIAKTFNSSFRLLFSKTTFSSTPELEYEPWKMLESHVGALEVEELFFGWMFMAWGRTQGTKGCGGAATNLHTSTAITMSAMHPLKSTSERVTSTSIKCHPDFCFSEVPWVKYLFLQHFSQ